MKKISLIMLLVSVIAFSYCTSGKKTMAKNPPVTYMADVAPLLSSNCAPCHFPPKGNKEPLNTYDAAKEEINEIIERISKNPGEKGFMPFKHDKLSDSVINVFVQWKAGGLKEK
jgi:mono/diheme cytochrome c family protein